MLFFEPARQFLEVWVLLIKEAIRKQNSPSEEDGGGYGKPMLVKTFE